MDEEHLNEETARVSELAADGDTDQLEAVLAKHDDAEVARILDGLPEAHMERVFAAVAPGRRSPVFFLLDPARQGALLEALEDGPAAALLAGLRPDDLTALLEDLGPIERQRELRLLPADVRERALGLLGYPEESVGRLMTTQYVGLRPEWTLERAMRQIRRRGPDSETIHTMYVVDDAGRLIDDIPLRRLILSDPEKVVADLMDREFLSLPANADREDAVELMRRYDVFVLPVVDGNGTLLGVVTVDDVLDVQQEEATEDFHKAGAVLPLTAGYRDTSRWTLVKARLPWLIILVFVGLLTATVITEYEATLEQMLILAAFIPMLIDSGGNTGAQASTLMVRALATGDVTLREWWRTFRKEAAIGFGLGGAMGAATFVIGYLLGGPLVGAIVGAGMLCIVVLANLMGMILPFLLTLVRRDPAVASSPLITTVVDVVGLLVYFGIATWALGRFG